VKRLIAFGAPIIVLLCLLCISVPVLADAPPDPPTPAITVVVDANGDNTSATVNANGDNNTVGVTANGNNTQVSVNGASLNNLVNSDQLSVVAQYSNPYIYNILTNTLEPLSNLITEILKNSSATSSQLTQLGILITNLQTSLSTNSSNLDLTMNGLAKAIIELGNIETDLVTLGENNTTLYSALGNLKTDLANYQTQVQAEQLVSDNRNSNNLAQESSERITTDTNLGKLISNNAYESSSQYNTLNSKYNDLRSNYDKILIITGSVTVILAVLLVILFIKIAKIKVHCT
jgi:hypothetical protein